MNTIELDAANQLGAIAKDIEKNEGVSLARATELAFARNRDLAHRYNTGNTLLHTYDLAPIDAELLRLQKSPEEVRLLADAVMDEHAKGIAGKGGAITPEAYAAALKQIGQRYPSLSAAAETGYIASGDYELLCTLIPSLGGDAERLHGAKPMFVEFSQRSSGARAYTQTASKPEKTEWRFKRIDGRWHEIA